MKTLILALLTSFTISISSAQSPVGNWKLISHLATFEGKTFDSHTALLTQRPCAARIVYRITDDGNYRLDASASACDESYVNIQQRLYSKTKWKLDGNKLFIGGKEGIGHTYSITFSGNKMVWKSEYGDVITYQKI
ncbi:lipocalin family protein [Dyadobacter sp. CY312]|uniref:lipocalin family protein n=1 Tax=Dyadobacter sp. CY312 TaxID=2907303 RepID=UPI001F222313|nr:lipocalin family protein [Dyadobacter sp. CY312]MCE7042034.1 lipocalin family protein [Dyadobacter sp. CY312]